MDLIFPHHECEIAQAVASQGSEMVHYWMHNNMITINGQKMGKSLGNFITLEQFFTGQHPQLTQAYSPMTIRFFILQAHYRSTVDFSNEALQASRRGMERLFDAIRQLDHIQAQADGKITEAYAQEVEQKCYEAMDDDLNTPIVISHLFDACHTVNQLVNHQLTITPQGLQALTQIFHTFVFDLLGMKAEESGSNQREQAYSQAIDLLLDIRSQAKSNKDWATSDKIRDALTQIGFEVKDTKDGATWKLNR